MSLYELFLDRINSLSFKEPELDTYFRVYACKFTNISTEEDIQDITRSQEELTTFEKDRCANGWLSSEEAKAISNYMMLEENQRLLFFITVTTKLVLCRLEKIFDAQPAFWHRLQRRRNLFINRMMNKYNKKLKALHVSTLHRDGKEHSMSEVHSGTMHRSNESPVLSVQNIESDDNNADTNNLDRKHAKEGVVSNDCRSSGPREERSADVAAYLRCLDDRKRDVIHSVISHFAMLYFSALAISTRGGTPSEVELHVRDCVEYVNHMRRFNARPRNLLTEYHNSRNAQFFEFLSSWRAYFVQPSQHRKQVSLREEHVESDNDTPITHMLTTFADEKIDARSVGADDRYWKEGDKKNNPTETESNAGGEIDTSFIEVCHMLNEFKNCGSPRESAFFQIWVREVKKMDGENTSHYEKGLVTRESSKSVEEMNVVRTYMSVEEGLTEGKRMPAIRNDREHEIELLNPNLIKRAEALLYPCEARTNGKGLFSEFICLTPYCDDEEVEVFLKYTCANLTELPDGDEAHSLLPESDKNQNSHICAASSGSMSSNRRPVMSVKHGFASNASSTNLSISQSKEFQRSFPSLLIPPQLCLSDYIETSEYFSRLGQLTILHGTCIIRIDLCNPFPFISRSEGEIECDTCFQKGLQVGFQAVTGYNMRDFFCFRQNKYGYDVCLPCAVFLYKAAFQRVARALHPDLQLNRPFAHGPHSGAVVWSLSTRLMTSNYIAGAHNIGAHHEKSEEDRHKEQAGVGGEGFIVTMKVGVSPYGVYPVAWLVEKHQLQTMCMTFPSHHLQATSDRSAKSDYPMTEAEESFTLTSERITAIPVPPWNWSRYCRIVSNTLSMLQAPVNGNAVATDYTSQQTEFKGEERYNNGEELCSVCLQTLLSSVPVLRTRCGHWFHVNCIQSVHHHQQKRGERNENVDHGSEGLHEISEEYDSDEDHGGHDRCPMCRQVNYMPNMSKKLTLEQNLYTVELQVPIIRPRARKLEKKSQIDQEDSNVKDTDEYVVAVATLLTEDGKYYNPTNIASCQLLYIRQGMLYEYETFD